MNNKAPERDEIHPGGTTQSYTRTYGTRRVPRHSFFWPIALIGFGVLLLLANMGLIPSTSWAILWRLWPVALIALGVDVLVGHRSIGGAIASGVITLVLVGVAIGVVVFAGQIPFLVQLARPAVMQTDHVAEPLAGIEAASVSIDWSSAPGFLSALEDSPNLIEADITYRGDLDFDADTTTSPAKVRLATYVQGISAGTLTFGDTKPWQVALSPLVPLDVQLDAGSGRYEFDLSQLDVTHLEIDAGSGSITLSLPRSSSFDGTIDGGSGHLTVVVPDAVGLRVELDDGSGAFRPGATMQLVSGEADGDGVWETEGYDHADYRIDLAIDQGSGGLVIQ